VIGTRLGRVRDTYCLRMAQGAHGGQSLGHGAAGLVQASEGEGGEGDQLVCGGGSSVWEGLALRFAVSEEIAVCRCGRT
jgi:hypothetical protein